MRPRQCGSGRSPCGRGARTSEPAGWLWVTARLDRGDHVEYPQPAGQDRDHHPVPVAVLLVAQCRGRRRQSRRRGVQPRQSPPCGEVRWRPRSGMRLLGRDRVPVRHPRPLRSPTRRLHRRCRSVAAPDHGIAVGRPDPVRTGTTSASVSTSEPSRRKRSRGR